MDNRQPWISQSCSRRYRAYQRWCCRERCSTLSQIIRLKASVEHWLVETILDPDKEHGEIFRYMQLANTAYSAQYKIDVLRTMNYMASYETKWKNQRGLSSIESSIQNCALAARKKKPLTVEKLKTLYLLLTTWWRTLIRNQFQKSKLQ